MSDDNLFLDANDKDQQQPREEGRRQQSNDRVEREPEQRSVGGWTLADLGKVQNRPTLGGLTDGALALMIDTFEKSKERVGNRVPSEISPDRFRVLPLTGQRAGSQMSSLIVTLPARIADKSYAITYLCLLEPAGPLATRTLNDSSHTFEALYLPTDRLSDKYLKLVRDEVQTETQNATVVIAGRQVITATTIADLNEKDGISTIEKIFDNAFDAICGYLQNMKDAITGKRNSENRITPEAIGRRDRLESSFDFSGVQPTDTSGLPICSDVAMKLWYSAADSDEDGNYNRQELAEVRLGLNLYLDQSVGRETLAFGRGRNRRPEDDRAPFQAVLTINNVTAPQGVPFSLELAQLAIAPIAILSNDFRWAEILRPKASLPGGYKPAYNVKDLALFAEGLTDEQRHAIMSAVTPNIADGDLSEYLDLVVQPNIAFAISTAASCEKSWVLSIFEKIALAKTESERLNLTRALYDSADVLTGNRFRKVLRSLGGDDSTAPVQLTGNATLIGTWVDTDGRTRDLRELNVQTVLSKVGAKGLQVVEDFQYTIQDDRRPEALNIAERFSMLNKLFPSVHVVDKAPQIGLVPVYLEALNISLAEAQMASVPTSLEGIQTRRRLGSGGYGSLATNDIGQTRRGSSSGLSGLGRDSSGLLGDRYY